ncbi:MAG: peptide ABC transporter substrate-binding protein [Mycoplasmatales bacterium]
MKKNLLIYLLILVVLAGCTTSSSASFVFPTNEVETLDSRKATYSETAQLITDTQAMLLKVNDKQEAVNGSAESVEAQNNGMSYLIKLKPNVAWVDNKGQEIRKVKAQDYVDAWKYIVDPANQTAYAFIFDGFKNASKIIAGELPVDEFGAKVLDELTIQVDLEYAVPYFKDLLSFFPFAPVNTEYIESKGEAYAKDAENMLFSGPYYVTDFEKASEINLLANEKYYDYDNVQVKKLTYRTMKDLTTEFNAFQTNEVNYSRFPTGKDYQTAKANNTAIDSPRACMNYSSINTTAAQTSNVNLRKALQFSFDAKTAVDTVYDDGSIATGDLITKGLTTSSYGFDYREKYKGGFITFDTEKAKEYLAQAINELGLKQASDIKISYLTEDTTQTKRNAEIIQQMYQENLGIIVEPIILPTEQYRTARRNGSFDIAGGRWCADYGDPDTFLQVFTSANVDGLNAPRYSNQEYDRKMNEAKVIIDANKRFAKMYELEKKIVVDDAILIPYFQQNIAYQITDGMTLGDHPYQKVSFEYIRLNN